MAITTASRFVTDAGMETDLIFHHGIDLPFFAAFPLLAQDSGRAVLTRYYEAFAAVAAGAQAGLMLESPTWRANPDWGTRLGYTPQALARANTDGIDLLARLRDRYAATVGEILVSGTVGPRGDGYEPDLLMAPADAADYHSAQIRAFADAGADFVTAYTLTHTGEAIGVVQAARAAGLPVAISFTVETDGRLPGGVSLADAVTTVDSIAAPDYFLVNCAHPTHVEPGFAEGGEWLARIQGLRSNASELSHAELDEAETLDDGDPVALVAAHRRLESLLPNLRIIGGCCGTDVRHVAALWQDA
jgi:homocysteine S-methyltransferase